MSAGKVLTQVAPAADNAESSQSSKTVTAVEAVRTARKRRAQRVARSLALWVGVPTLLSFLYFLALAPDEYVSTATLMVRTRSGVPLNRQGMPMWVAPSVSGCGSRTHMPRASSSGSSATSFGV